MNKVQHYQTFVGETMGIYQEAIGPDKILRLAYCALGLGETGEVQGKIKKIIRDKGGVISNEDRVALMYELGDTLWYITAMANELGYDLQDVIDLNVQKLSDRRARGTLQGSGDNR